MYIKDMPMSVKITLEELVMRIICWELNVNEFAHIYLKIAIILFVYTCRCIVTVARMH